MTHCIIINIIVIYIYHNGFISMWKTLIYCLKNLCGFSFVCAVFCILVGVLCVAMWILEQFHAFKTLNCPDEGEGEILF